MKEKPWHGKAATKIMMTTKARTDKEELFIGAIRLTASRRRLCKSVCMILKSIEPRITVTKRLPAEGRQVCYRDLRTEVLTLTILLFENVT